VFLLAHILGMPLEELVILVAGGTTGGAFAFLASALASRAKRR
jgi:hypothetical protein